MLLCCSDKSSDESSLLDDIANNPHEVFANDLIFFLCQEYKVLWLPPCYQTYAIHPKSPLTDDFRQVLRSWYGRIYASCYLNHYRRFKENSLSDWEMFQEYTNEITSMLRGLSHTNMLMDAAFSKILQVAISSIVWYERGMLEALTFGASIMTESLGEFNRKNNGQLLNLLSAHASLLADRYKLDIALLCDIKKLHHVFATDLIFFLCNEFKVSWLPPGCIRYEIRAKSPLTVHIRRILKRLVFNSDLMYYKYKAQCKKRDEAVKVFLQEMTYTVEIFSSVRVPDDMPVEEVLQKLAAVARLSVMFYQHGADHVLSPTIEKIAEALKECNRKNNGRIFDLFSVYACDIFARGFPVKNYSRHT